MTETTTVAMRQPSWSSKATDVAGLKTFAEARERLGLDWELVRRPRTDPGAERWTDIIRTDTGEVIHPAATDSFHLVNLADFGTFVESSLKETNVQWDTFHVFDRGAAQFSTIRLDEPLTIPGDGSPVYPFMGFANRVDGKGSLRSFLAMERGWCANMLNTMAMNASKSGGMIKFTHSARFSMEAAIRATRSMIEREREMSKEFVAQAGRLNQITVSTDVFVKRWLPHSEDMTDKQHNNVELKRLRFFTALNGPYKPDRQDTAWAVLQAAVEAFQYTFSIKGEQAREKRAMSMLTPSMAQQHDLRKAYALVKSYL